MHHGQHRGPTDERGPTALGITEAVGILWNITLEYLEYFGIFGILLWNIWNITLQLIACVY